MGGYACVMAARRRMHSRERTSLLEHAKVCIRNRRRLRRARRVGIVACWSVVVFILYEVFEGEIDRVLLCSDLLLRDCYQHICSILCRLFHASFDIFPCCITQMLVEYAFYL